jgi:dCMP deaminase
MSHDRGCYCGREKYEAQECSDPTCPHTLETQLGAVLQTNLSRERKWDYDFLALARFWADLKSKDPSTKVGAVLVDSDRRILAMGYNGFPRGIEDRADRLLDRETKLKLVAHAEANAILTVRAPIPDFTTLYSTLMPCNECAKLIIQAGIWRVVAPHYNIPGKEKWLDLFDLSRDMFAEAGVQLELLG